MTDRCNAKTRAGNECQRPAGWGTLHVGAGNCKLHGGSTRNGELSGAVTLAQREAKRLGREVPIHPHDAIVWSIEIAAGELMYANEQVAHLDIERWVTVSDRLVHPWVVFRNQANDRLMNYAAIAARVGIEERRVQLAEQHGERIAKVIRAVLLERGVDPDAPETRESVRRHLTLVAGDGPVQG